eukprot:1214623-Prymnesium_polylepis.2
MRDQCAVCLTRAGLHPSILAFLAGCFVPRAADDGSDDKPVEAKQRLPDKARHATEAGHTLVAATVAHHEAPGVLSGIVPPPGWCGVAAAQDGPLACPVPTGSEPVGAAYAVWRRHGTTSTPRGGVGPGPVHGLGEYRRDRLLYGFTAFRFVHCGFTDYSLEVTAASR